MQRWPWRSAEIRCRPFFDPVVLQLHHVLTEDIQIPGNAGTSWQARTTCGRFPEMRRRRPPRCCVCCWIPAAAPVPRMLWQPCCTSCEAPSTASCRMVVGPECPLRPACARQLRVALVWSLIMCCPQTGNPPGCRLLQRLCCGAAKSLWAMSPSRRTLAKVDTSTRRALNLHFLRF